MLFNQVDSILAFAIIMLLLSLLITAGVQLLVAVLGLRGRNLLWGVEQLLRQIAPKLDQDDHRQAAAVAARQVLSDPIWATSTNYLARAFDALVDRSTSRPRMLDGGRRPPIHVERKDLQLVLSSLVSNGKLEQALTQQFPNQAKALKLVVDGALAQKKELEKKLEDWFDLVMDATSERFKLRSRWLTAAGALVLAFGMQVDAIEIFNRLSSDADARADVIEQLPAIEALNARLEAEVSAPAPVGDEAAKQRVETAQALLSDVRAETGKSGLVLLRTYSSWHAFKAGLSERSFWGMLATTLLLSLGAPFWYGTLQNVLRFRSAVTERPKPAGDDS